MTAARRRRPAVMRMLLVVAAAAALLLAALSLASGLPTSLKIGWSGPLAERKLDGSVNVDSTALGQPSLIGYLMAVAECNNSTEWLPFTQLEGLHTDTLSDPSTIIAAAFDFVQKGVVVVVGEIKDIPETQNVLKRYRVPQISPNSFLAEMTTNHDTLYPYFMRNTVSINIIMRELVRLVKALGYSRVGFVYSNEGFAVSGSTVFYSWIAVEKVTVAVTANYLAGEKDWSTVIDRLVNGKARVIVFLGNPFDLQALWRYAANLSPERNVGGDGFLWLLNHGLTAPVLTTDLVTHAPAPDLQRIVAGQVGLMLKVDPIGADALAHFKQLYYSFPPNPNAPSAITNSTFEKNPFGYTAQFTYDATWQAIRALHRLLHELELDPRLQENRPILFEAMKNVTFIGSTGPIETDSKGDRQTYFAVGNFKRATNSFVRVGDLGPGAVPQIAFYSDASIEWPVHPTVQPLDTPLPPTRELIVLSESVKSAVIATASVILLLCFVLEIGVIVMRNNRILKASSPLFLLTFLLGLQLLCASVIPRTFESDPHTSPIPCDADLFMANLGYVIIVGSLLVKTARIHFIFNRRTLKSAFALNDPRLFVILVCMVALECCLLIGLSVGAPMSIQLRELKELQDYYLCRTSSSSNDILNMHLPATISVRFFLLVVTAVFVFRIRHIPDNFNESKQLTMTIYNLLFLSVLLPAIDGTLGRGLDTPLIAYSICIFLICSVSMCIMFLPKMATMYSALTALPKPPVVKDSVAQKARALEMAIGRATGPPASSGLIAKHPNRLVLPTYTLRAQPLAMGPTANSRAQAGSAAHSNESALGSLPEEQSNHTIDTTSSKSPLQRTTPSASAHAATYDSTRTYPRGSLSSTATPRTAGAGPSMHVSLELMSQLSNFLELRSEFEEFRTLRQRNGGTLDAAHLPSVHVASPSVDDSLDPQSVRVHIRPS